MSHKILNLNGLLAVKCPHCEETFELTDQNFYRSRGNFVLPCKNCFKARTIAAERKRKERLKVERPAFYRMLTNRWRKYAHTRKERALCIAAKNGNYNSLSHIRKTGGGWQKQSPPPFERAAS